MGVVSTANDMVQPPSKLMTWEHDDVAAAKALETDIRADAGYAPVDRTTGMRLAERDDVAGEDAIRIVLACVTHCVWMSSCTG